MSATKLVTGMVTKSYVGLIGEGLGVGRYLHLTELIGVGVGVASMVSGHSNTGANGVPMKEIESNATVAISEDGRNLLLPVRVVVTVV